MQLLSRKEAARLLNVSIKTIDRLRKSKQLTTITIGRRVMVTQESIKLWDANTKKSHALHRSGNFYICWRDGKRSREISTRTSKQEEAQIIFGHWLAEGGAKIKEATKDPVLMDVVRDWYEENVFMIQPSGSEQDQSLKTSTDFSVKCGLAKLTARCKRNI